MTDGRSSTQTQYRTLKRPSWAPPSWVFGPVWSALYIIIAITFGSVGYAYLTSVIPFIVLLPFILNLASNAAFTAIQFGMRNNVLALLDILIVLGTLLWAMTAIFNYFPWVAYCNVPYLLWVAFATLLQSSITHLNR